ncbi:MAG: glycosyltransferase [Deltaproteobacteria bacterium]|nr:glycosyltransferase [Deltaproteobacteria bacterium]
MLAIITTHPIQYQVPVWQELARRREVLFEVWYISDQGYRSSFDAGFQRAFSWDLDMLAGYPHRFIPTRPLKARVNTFCGAWVRSLRSLFEQRAVTALLINGWYPQAYWQAAFQAQRAGIPVLLRGETNDLRQGSWWKEIVKRPLLKLLFQRVSIFLTVGAANRRLYQKYGVPESKLGSAPYCVDNKRFSEAAEALRSQRVDLRRSWGIPQDGICFLFSGKLVPKKRPQDLLAALEMLLLERERFDLKYPVHLLIAGDGILRKPLEEQACALSKIARRSCVTFTGFLNQTEMPKAYAAADCLVLPSDARETWGLVVNEAMASGLPCIVSGQVGCGADLIDPGMTGDLYPTGDVRRLAIAMAAWVDPGRRGCARDAVRKKVAAYSVERAAEGILEGVTAVSRRFSHRKISQKSAFSVGDRKNG